MVCLCDRLSRIQSLNRSVPEPACGAECMDAFGARLKAQEVLRDVGSKGTSVFDQVPGYRCGARTACLRPRLDAWATLLHLVVYGTRIARQESLNHGGGAAGMIHSFISQSPMHYSTVCAVTSGGLCYGSLATTLCMAMRSASLVQLGRKCHGYSRD